ncbi:MAG: transcription antitermination protein [Salinigranum sp.]
MDGSTLADDVRDDYETPISRLGSSKWIYALTGGEMDADHVRDAANDDAQTAANVFEEWAKTEADDDAAALFREVVEAATTRRERIDSEAGTPDIERPMYEVLLDLDDTAERLGGLLGWALVERQTVGQMVGFFVGDADPRTADLFREVRGDVEEHRDRTVALLDEACESDDDWETAATAAGAVVEAAYDEYVETLESMGVKPKNVC